LSSFTYQNNASNGSGGWGTPLTSNAINYLYLGSKPLNYADGKVGSNEGAAQYYPYGQVLSGTTPNETQAFGSYVQDESGMLYADQRFYYQNWGRFLTADPFRGSANLSNSSTWNRYTYSLGDPINGRDPSGLCSSDSGADDYVGSCYCPPQYQYCDQGPPGTDYGINDPSQGNCGTTTGFVDGGTDNNVGTPETVGEGTGCVTPSVTPVSSTNACWVDLGYQGAVFPWQHLTNHDYLYVQPYPGGPYEVLDAGPTRTNPFIMAPGWSGLPQPVYVGFGPMITQVSPSGLYNEANDPGSIAIWDQQEPCSLVSDLVADTYALNGVYEYGGLNNNSNSFVFSILSDVGILSQFPQPPNSPGWGTLLPVPAVP
jgi:RHS repeat-associated protein